MSGTASSGGTVSSGGTISSGTTVQSGGTIGAQAVEDAVVSHVDTDAIAQTRQLVDTSARVTNVGLTEAQEALIEAGATLAHSGTITPNSLDSVHADMLNAGTLATTEPPPVNGGTAAATGTIASKGTT